MGKALKNDGIFVDDATSFHLRRKDMVSGDGKVDALITGNIGVGALYCHSIFRNNY